MLIIWQKPKSSFQLLHLSNFGLLVEVLNKQHLSMNLCSIFSMPNHQLRDSVKGEPQPSGEQKMINDPRRKKISVAPQLWRLIRQ